MPEVGLVELSALKLHDTGHISELALRRRHLIPVEFVQQNVLGRGQPNRLAKPCVLNATGEHFSLEWIRPQQPKIGFQRRWNVNQIELMRRLIGAPHGIFVEMKVWADKGGHKAWNL